MLLTPKKSKFKKFHKNRLSRLDLKSNKLRFGSIGLQSIESGVLVSKQLESARQAINRKIKRKGKIWIRVFPHFSITSKPTAVRMGKGKGPVTSWAAKIGKGSILFELDGINLNLARLAFKTGSAKLPVKTKVICL